MWRAWGRGLWWTQTKDDWIGHVTDPGYQWRGPRLDVNLDHDAVLALVVEAALKESA